MKTAVSISRAVAGRLPSWRDTAAAVVEAGEGSSAAAAVAKKIGLCDREILVKMPGGEIEITISENYDIHMSGPATRVGTMTLDDKFLDGAG